MEIVIPDEFKHLFVRSEQRPVVKIPDPVLRRKCVEVTSLNKKTDFLIAEMQRVMRKANGIGLAAPQLGVASRIILIAPNDFKPTILINPIITHMEGEQVGQEGCLSIPGLYGDVKRHQMIKVEAMDRKGREFEFELEGLPARVVQHEMDHLDGVLFTDKVDPLTLYWSGPDLPDHDEK
jgi:peptide deformylase